jgi:hypothetical protein
MPEQTADQTVTAALAEAEAAKTLSRATGRIGKLLGLNVQAATNANPAKTTVALAVLGETPAVVVTTSETKAGALTNAAGFLDRLSDAFEARWHQRYPTRPVPERKPMPETKPQVMPSVRRIG